MSSVRRSAQHIWWSLLAPQFLLPTSRPPISRGAENLRWAGDFGREHGVRLGIEFLKGSRFVNNLDTALRLSALTNHSHVGVLVDTFHLYAGASKLEDLEARDAPDQLFFVHLNDVPIEPPRDLWVDTDRVLPGEGCLPLADILGKIRRTGYNGYVSLELFNVAFAERWASELEGAARAPTPALQPRSNWPADANGTCWAADLSGA